MSPMTSSYHGDLRTNHCPTDLEFQQLRDISSVARTKIALIGGEISHLEDVLNQLYREYDELHDFAAQHERLISPVRRVPREIWQQIFMSCLPPDLQLIDDIHTDQLLILPNEPLVLSHVCSGWRNIVLASSELWCNFSIVIPRRMSSWNLSAYGWMITRLLRSGTRPLVVQLHSPNSGAHAVNQASFGEVFDALVPLSHRWSELHMNVPFSSLEVLTSLRSHDTPLLEALTIYDYDEDVRSGSLNIDNQISQELASKLLFAQNAPKLHVLGLGCVPQRIQVPCGQLSKLTLSHLSSDSVFDILTLCTNLQEFSCAYVLTPGVGRGAIRLLKLHSLVLNECLPAVGRHIFAPGLKTVVFAKSKPINLTDFIPESRSSLESVTILSQAWSQAGLLDYLDMARSLTRIIIRTTPGNAAPGDLLFAFLGPTNGDPAKPRCPMLQELELATLENLPSFESLRSFLSFRCQPFRQVGIKRLTRVELGVHHIERYHWSDIVETIIRPYEDEDVRISITGL